MWRRLLRRKVEAFERTFGYDAGYMKEVLEVSPRAFLAVARLQGLAGHRGGVPVAAWYAAKLVGAQHEDCGPCTQLVVTMAERAGVPAPVLRAVLRRDEGAMGPDAALAVRWAEATVARDPRAAAERAEITRRWGRQGLIGLAFGMVGSRLYPTLKYALGHGVACTRVVVGGQPEPVSHRPAA